MKKFILLFSIVMISGIWVFLFIEEWLSIWNVNANPDYICTKMVDYPCEVKDYPEGCENWDSSWNRKCYWKKAINISYKNRRTWCARWWNQNKVGDSWWKSWRQGADYVSKTESCYIVESDHVATIGEIN